jgi:hypothetical protein
MIDERAGHRDTHDDPGEQPDQGARLDQEHHQRREHVEVLLDGQAPEMALADAIHAHGEGAEIGQVAEVPEEAVAGDGIRAAREKEERARMAMKR